MAKSANAPTVEMGHQNSLDRNIGLRNNWTKRFGHLVLENSMFKFLKTRQERAEIDQLIRFDASTDERFSELDLGVIKQALSDARNQRTVSISKSDIEVVVRHFIGSPEETGLSEFLITKRRASQIELSTDKFPDMMESRRTAPKSEKTEILASIAPKETWSLQFSDTFSRRLRKVDGKLKGKILQAFTEILVKPKEPRGNTLKPLTRDLTGLWRYRIGDYRLIYQPQDSPRVITMLDFGPRSSIYS
ncbi:type II toxin-antitoxin system RelE/ParE family toxin [Pseudomonadota bacterium]